MLDINKVYVVLFRDNATGHVTGDDPRMKPFLATNAMIEYEHGEPCLAYWAIGDERGHLLEGSIIRQLPNGIVFNARHINETLTLTEFTMQEFEQRCRPDMERMTPGSTRDLRTITDVYAFCRRTAPTIHQPEQEERPMKLTKADIDKVRHIEGFPIARDEDIIALSRPPYYTACPNPFIEDFIRENGTPYDEATDDYHREPFAADVSEGKNDPIYNAHSYHTKVPHKAIMRYILHYTKPGDIVFDGFCGTGMTAVAAHMCANPDYELRAQIESELPYVEWGERKAIINDLSPAATFIAYNYTMPMPYEKYKSEAERILREVSDQYSWMYETKHRDDRGYDIIGIDGKPIMGHIDYTIWSDAFICPSCAKEFIFYDAATNANGTVSDSFSCPHCGAKLSKRDCDRSKVTVYDDLLDQSVIMTKQVPVLIVYSVGSKRFGKAPDDFDYELLERINRTAIPFKVPTDELPEGMNTDQPKKSHGVCHVHQFFTRRNLIALSAFWERICSTDDEVRPFLMQYFIGSLRILSKQAKHNKERRTENSGLGWVNAGLMGTLYISSCPAEQSVLFFMSKKTSKILPMNNRMGNTCISVGSCHTVPIPENSIDYIFTDPPFGANINYSELSFLWEAWLRVYTNNSPEAIINSTQKKGLAEYQALMEECFRKYYSVLKPGHWMTVEFHNSQNAVWNAIQESMQRVGFVVADVRTLDKKIGSFKQVRMEPGEGRSI